MYIMAEISVLIRGDYCVRDWEFTVVSRGRDENFLLLVVFDLSIFVFRYHGGYALF
jgi:hypothetical protein